GGRGRRLRDVRGRIAGRPQGAARQWHQCRGDPQPHDRRTAAGDVPALLGNRSHGQTCSRVEGSAGHAEKISLAHDGTNDGWRAARTKVNRKQTGSKRAGTRGITTLSEEIACVPAEWAACFPLAALG